ncbi:MAG: 1-aminocyclopropane-1-carboxylate deaminase/D-cysteine desulfhydrase [Bacteroidetes bacterium]|nr:MAG: 1-aminocyclopropane-1-carboxylate deaminase/D-cysteine desulfhydrase [Bacteroidota bacterium]
MFTNSKLAVIQEIIPEKNPNNVKLFIKREDLLHPIISGNKWRKLKYNLLAAQEAGETTLLTFGGAYSNHIHAVAGAAKEFGFNSIGVIRGEEHLPLNPTLQDAQDFGMEFYYLDRATYRLKHTEEVVNSLRKNFGSFYLVPEGGTNQLAIKGAAEIVEGIENDYDYFCLACGTAGTVIGIISGLQGGAEVIGFSILKGDFHQQEVKNWLSIIGQPEIKNWQINLDYHFGGYAKYNQQLVDFINNFKARYQIQLDPIYTGKMVYGVMELIARSEFPKESRILVIHTGGLQGVKGFNQRFNNLLNT